MLSLTSHTHAHGRGAETSGKCAHLAEWPNYKAKQKERKYYNNLYYQRRRERDTKSQTTKGKVRAPALALKLRVGFREQGERKSHSLG